ncbi:hypothetical protein [Methylobacterium sp. WSM2598]|uniref:hypothetical protein n=1 Tax=Methylobacterium sp. WSM2598 TaxID=398261 RepID=UPI000369F9B7|nr:hypothetical protein [Methylobacterium sp. WSM2598]
MLRIIVLALAALAAAAAPARAADLRRYTAPGAAPALDGAYPLGTAEVAINVADRKLFYRNPDGSLGDAALLRPVTAARTCVETGDCSGVSVKPTGATALNTIAAVLGRASYITDFLAPGEVTIDNALARAVAKFGPNGGKVIFPAQAACYALSLPFTVMKSNLTFEGDGMNPSCINSTFDGDVFKIGDGSAPVNPAHVRVRNINFTSSVPRTTGATIALRNTYNAQIENVACAVNVYVCLDIYGGPNAFLTRVANLVAGGGYVGIRIGFQDLGTYAADVMVLQPTIGSMTRAGIEIRHNGGTQLVGGDLLLSGIGILVNPQSGQSVQALHVVNTYLDTSTYEGLLIDPAGTGNVATLAFANLWTATNGTQTGYPGIRIKGTPQQTSGLSFVGGRSINNGGEGARLEGGAHVDFSNYQIGFNSRKAYNTYSGVYVAAGVSHWSFTGGRVGPVYGMANHDENQKYGIDIAAGASDYYSITADLSGNVSGALNNLATGAHFSVMAAGAPFGLAGASLGVGTASPNSPLSVVCATRPFSDAQAGGACLQLGAGAGAATDDGIFAGVLAGSYAWVQAAKPGSTTRPLMVNPNGGAVALGRSGMTTASTDGWPALPVTAGAPTGAPVGIPAGFAPVQLDSSGNRLWVYVGGAWRSVALN